MSPTMQQLSEEAVRSFVRTVLAVDDKITMDPDESVEPVGSEVAQLGPDDADDEMTEEGQQPAAAVSSKASGGLQGAKLTAAFAEEDVVCGLLRADKPDHVVAMARRCDVLILDWDLGDGTGNTATAIIRDLARRPPATEGYPTQSLRLVLVYSNDESAAIDAALKEQLATEKPERTLTGGLRFESGLVVDVLQKGDGPGGVETKDVPGEVFRRLATVVPGLVQGAALRAMSSLRDNALRLVSAFPPDIDLGYVGHRASTGDKDEAVSQVVGVIAAEIKALLEDEPSVPEAVGRDAVEAWVQAEEVSAGWSAKVFGGKSAKGKLIEADRMPPATLATWIEHDHSTSDEPADGPPEGWIKARSKILPAGRMTECIAGEAVSLESDRRWAAALGQRQIYADEQRHLTLGTIVRRTALNKDESLDRWFVCIQPLCDSIRIRPRRSEEENPDESTSATRSFLLLPIWEVQPSSLHLFFEGKWVGLSWETTKVYELTSAEFCATADGRVTAVPSAGGELDSAEEGTQYIWAGQLNASHAQRLTNHYSAQLSRPGVDEAEWQRQRLRPGTR